MKVIFPSLHRQTWFMCMGKVDKIFFIVSRNTRTHAHPSTSTFFQTFIGVICYPFP